VGAGFSTVTPPPSQVSATSVAQAVWSYTPRSLTDIQSLVNAIQNNDPRAVPNSVATSSTCQSRTTLAR